MQIRSPSFMHIVEKIKSLFVSDGWYRVKRAGNTNRLEKI